MEQGTDGTRIVPFAFLELNPEYRFIAIAAASDAIASTDERRLFSILTNVTDLDASVKVFSTEVKRHLRKHHGIEDPIGTDDLNGDSCLHYAARAGHAVVLRFLHHCGLLKHIDQYVNREGNTPLHDAVVGRRVMFAKQLMFLGADPKAKNNGGKSPLWLARKSANDELVAALSVRSVQCQNR